MGKPGSSFAIEIARKIGLPKEVVERATQLVGKDKIRYDRLLEGLEKEKTELETRTAEAAKAEKRLKRAAQEYQDLKQHLEDTKLETLRTAKQQAKALLVNTNQQIEATIGEIRRGKAEKETNKAAREKLETFVRTELQIEPPKPKATRERAEAGGLQPGDKVALFGQDGHGEVVSVKGNTAEVMFGGMKTLTKLSQLEKLGRAEIREREQAAKAKSRPAGRRRRRRRQRREHHRPHGRLQPHAGPARRAGRRRPHQNHELRGRRRDAGHARNQVPARPRQRRAPPGGARLPALAARRGQRGRRARRPRRRRRDHCRAEVKARFGGS